MFRIPITFATYSFRNNNEYGYYLCSSKKLLFYFLFLFLIPMTGTQIPWLGTGLRQGITGLGLRQKNYLSRLPCVALAKVTKASTATVAVACSFAVCTVLSTYFGHEQSSFLFIHRLPYNPQLSVPYQFRYLKQYLPRHENNKYLSLLHLR